MKLAGKTFLAMFSAGFFTLAAGCRSHHVDITVENRTGAAVKLLEVDYPNASFGADSIADGGSMPYRIEVTGNGPVKVTYTAPDGHQPAITGPALREKQDGKLEIVLLPDGKADFQSR